MPEHELRPGDNLKYLSDMLEQLKHLAGRSGQPFLAYLIDIARTEAQERARGVAKRGESGEQRHPAAGMPLDPPGEV